MQTLFWAFYQIAAGLALLTAGPFLLVRRGGHYLEVLPGRLLGPGPGSASEAEEPLWIHAVSVGEVGVAATLARALPSALPLVVTTITPTGQERARRAFAGRAAVAYLPFELGFAVRRFFRRVAPRALVLVEGDLWPLVLREARRRELPVLVVNGRVSDRSFRRLRRLRPLLGPLFHRVDRFGVQSAEDRRKLLDLGIPAGRVTVTGNLKYESPAPERKPDLEAALGRLAAGRPLLLAGSTMAGEEEAVLDAFARLGGGERALLLLAPRHPERWDEVDRLLAARGLRHGRRSRLAEIGSPADPLPDPSGALDVLLLDSLGELAGLYSQAAAAFVGGTLVPTGGHNPLEPARFGVPTAVGPSMENFRDMAERFDQAGAWGRVADAAGLAACWGAWLADPAAARAVGERASRLVEENRGALAATLRLLEPLLAGPAAPLSPSTTA
ncbi:MAG TPA: 3-deoxy-D-manno-octulosonic acid transferase [Thermoanaerobaculia bacterium]|nr:3-deoxy-D-manno-octulosonic acid transferase [Thermoanaerobaculia bacterium]